MNLTAEQMAAVESEAHEVLCVAPAGSGKSRVLVARIQWLLEQKGASPSELCVITFTRKAAGELRERIAAEIGEKDLKGMLCSTFHGVALSILRAEGDKLGYAPDSLTILDQTDADALLEEAAKELGYMKLSDKGKATWLGGLSFDRVAKFRESQYTGQAIKDDWARDVSLFKIYRAYQFKMREFNCLDFGSILDQCRLLLREFPDVRQRYQSRIRWVCCDEGQDCSVADWEFLKFFCPPAGLFIVGDVRQAIFGFRGTRPDILISAMEGRTAFQLRTCFRCGDSIVQAGNSLIAKNNEPLAEPMIADESTGKGKVSAFHGRSEDIIIEAGKCLQSGFAPSDIAILARNHRTLRRLEEVANEMSVPVYRVGARFDICETEEFRLTHAIMRFAVNPKDSIAAWKIGKNQIEGFAFDAGGETVGDFWKFCQGPRFADPVRFWLRNCGAMSVADALRWYAMLGTQQYQRLDSGEDRPEGGAITLCTVHAAKGLEWPVVIVAGCQEGEFPASRALKEPHGEREERRLFYVAATRAKERLLLHYRSPEDQAEDRTVTKPSRFIVECGA